jgi:hypothetical protein
LRTRVISRKSIFKAEYLMFKTSHFSVGTGLLSAALVTAVISAGCGSGGMQTSNSNNGNPPTSVASNPATGGGGSGSTGSGGSGGAGSGSSGGGVGGAGGGTVAYYFEALLSTADSSNHGMISLNASGAGTVQLQGAASNTSYSVQFCLFPSGTGNCFSVGSSSTDSTGNAQTSFTFSRSGTWVGVFLLQPSGGGTGFTSSFPIPSSGIQYQSPVQQAGAVSGGIPSFLGPPGSDPLSSGFVTISGTIAHITLTGASANAKYTVGLCGNGGGSSCFADLGTVTTDASGNGSGDIETSGRNFPGVFHLGRNNVVQFITGIRVP